MNGRIELLRKNSQSNKSTTFIFFITRNFIIFSTNSLSTTFPSFHPSIQTYGICESYISNIALVEFNSQS